MTIWWESLSNVQQILALLAIPATLLMVLQTLLLLFGLGHQGGAEGDVGAGGHDGGGGPDHPDGGQLEEAAPAHQEAPHDSGLRIFTVRAFVAFFSIFGWLGIVLLDGGMNIPLAITLAFLAGTAAMAGMAYFFKSAMRLQSAGNIDMRNSLGKTATVYIPIPPNRSGKGKVTLTVQGRFTEAEAVTDSDLRLKTGAEVLVTSISNQNMLCVTPLHETAGDK